ncbi:MAG: AAA family ATPase, partial [Chloroflexi bacterium]|nr:AAA family ATPase [Chloroflexota bacterium]
MPELTPNEIVAQLDRYVVGQKDAKKALAVALRNRYRRRHLAPEIAAEVTPKNLMMIGPTGVGKTELARRLAKLHDAPFIKVEATKFTEVGYVGRDVDSIIRDLVENAINMEHDAKQEEVRSRAEELAQERIVEALLSKREPTEEASEGDGAEKPAKREKARLTRKRRQIVAALSANKLDEQVIEIETEPEESYAPVMEFISGMTPEELTDNIQDFVQHISAQHRKRSRQVSVREARRILTLEES